jgi:hypothetical protein
MLSDKVQLITTPRKNMKSQNLSQTEKILLRKRVMTECFNDQLEHL